MNDSTLDFDLVIVGGGLAGLALARALRASRLKVALLENRPPARVEGWDARVYAVSPANVDFLREIGVWDHLDARRLSPVYAMEIFGDAGARLDFSAYEAGVDALAWVAESSAMSLELWESVKRQGNVALFCPAAPVGLAIDEERAALRLSDGRTLGARLIVGADGRDSWVREAANLAAHDAPYGEMGVVAHFTCERPHRGIARQWFRNDGILAWLPLAGKDGASLISIVWSTPASHAEDLLRLPPETLGARVAAAGDHALGALSPLAAPRAFPLSLLRVPRIVAPRLALIGDAAHGIHPLSGHGINLGFQDARALGRLLAATPEWVDIGGKRRLSRYARARREEVLVLQTATDALHRLFREKLRAFRFARNAGMNLINALPVVKNALVNYALGIH